MHPDFMTSQVLTFDLVCDLVAAIPQRVKDKFQSLNVTLSRVVGMWERSGQGDGGVVDDEEDEEDNDNNGDEDDDNNGRFDESRLPEYGSL